MKRVKICNIYNYPSHYRKSIYKLLDTEYDCSFVFGDEKSDIKTFDISELKDATFYHVVTFGHYLFTNRILKFLFKNYDYYILTIATDNLTHWLFFLLAKLFRRKKVYVWGHGMYGFENKLQMLVRKSYFALTDGILVYGDYAKRIMLQAGFSEEKIIPIHNSLDYDEQLKIRKTLKDTDIYKSHFDNTNPVLLFIGRLTKVKKLDLLVNAVSILQNKGEDYNIVFVGDGTEKAYIQNLCHQLGLDDKVWFYGASYDEQTNASLIYNADLCVSPGNVGLTSIHCFSFGTPVITHNNFSRQMPEFEVIKEGQTGAFFEMDNVDSLANVISGWFKVNRNNRDSIRNSCFDIIDKEWNPNYQISVLKDIIG